MSVLITFLFLFLFLSFWLWLWLWLWLWFFFFSFFSFFSSFFSSLTLLLFSVCTTKHHIRAVRFAEVAVSRRLNRRAACKHRCSWCWEHMVRVMALLLAYVLWLSGGIL